MSLLLTLIEVVARGEYAHRQSCVSRCRRYWRSPDRCHDPRRIHWTDALDNKERPLRRFQNPRIFILFGEAKGDLSAQFYHHRDLSIGRFGTGLVSNLVLNCIIGVPSLFSVEIGAQRWSFLLNINLQFQLTASGPDLATGPSAPCHAAAGSNGGAGRCSWRRRGAVAGASGEQRRQGSAKQIFVQILQVGNELITCYKGAFLSLMTKVMNICH